MEIDEVDVMSTLENIRKIANSTAAKVSDPSVKGQIERIAGLADSALSRNQSPKGPGPEVNGG